MPRGDSNHPTDATSQPWHNRTPVVVGVSALALAVIALLILAATYLSRHFGEPEPGPLNFVEPTFSATSPSTATPTTTQTITSTSAPQTTEIGGPLDPSTPPSTTSPGESSSAMSSESPSAESDDDEESAENTTRRRPRTNVTRTLYPLP